jgi:hypothetical protein
MKEKMYMAWHCGEEMLLPEIYGKTKKEYKENLNRVEIIIKAKFK